MAEQGSRAARSGSEDDTMRTFIITLWFLLAVSTVWACEVQPLFSPYDKVDDAIHAQLMQASKSVHCSLYGITNRRLANDLIAAKKREADVVVGLDKKQIGRASCRERV